MLAYSPGERWRRRGILLIVLSLLPWILGNRFYLRLATEILIYGLLAMSLDVLLGYTGLLSFMHAVYMGIAAYTVGLYLKYVDPSASIWLLLFLGVGATVLIAFPIGWLQVRTGGFAFALLTIAFGMMLYTIVWKARNLTGGDDGLIGIPSPNVKLEPFGSCRLQGSDLDLFYHPDRGDPLFLPHLADHALSLRCGPRVHTRE